MSWLSPARSSPIDKDPPARPSPDRADSSDPGHPHPHVHLPRLSPALVAIAGEGLCRAVEALPHRSPVGVEVRCHRQDEYPRDRAEYLKLWGPPDRAVGDHRYCLWGPAAVDLGATGRPSAHRHWFKAACSRMLWLPVSTQTVLCTIRSMIASAWTPDPSR